METVSPFKEAIDIIKEAGGETLKLCYQCGLCDTACPWNTVSTLRLRRMVREAQFGLVDFEDEALWACVTCRNCVQRCPRGVEVIDVMRSLRRAIVGLGVANVPDSLRITTKNIAGTGNPLGELPEKRIDWAKDLSVKIYAEEAEILYLPCCIPAYDRRVQRVARSTVNILKKADVKFGILDAKEVCCGESVRKAGDESLFRNLAQRNISAFAEAGVKKIVTTSPHCFYTFKNEYPELGGNFEVIHFSQYLAELIKEGRLRFTKDLNEKVTYHDPCYLGRHSSIYDEPREVLQSIPSLELIEMLDSHENSLCCGGGGGRIWMETKKGERFSDLRIEQALETGASILAVACPYCMLNFEDSVLTLDRYHIEIKDITEVIQEVL
ncbi:(Fe-S)-binding protein [Chloroflexota bacterium]